MRTTRMTALRVFPIKIGDSIRRMHVGEEFDAPRDRVRHLKNTGKARLAGKHKEPRR